jgi:hypothetical protein
VNRTAHSIARTGFMRARDEHLQAANECGPCPQTCFQGRTCGARHQQANAPRLSLLRRARLALWPLEREWRLFQLRWQRRDMHPAHPGLPTVLQELSDIEHRDTPPVTVDMAQMWAYLTVIALALSAVAMVAYGLTRLP